MRQRKKRTFDAVAYIIIIIFALAFLYIGNNIATAGLTIFDHDDDFQTFEAEVLSILTVDEQEMATEVTFEARIIRGERRGETMIATQYIMDFFGIIEDMIAVGDNVIIISPSEDVRYFAGQIRIQTIIYLGIAFMILLIFFGKSKGLNAILSLGFTCVAIFAVFIPSILSGRNIYVWALIVCVYSIVVTLLIVYGINKKSIAAITGCFGGVIAASLLTLFMSNALELTGMLNEESIHLTFLPVENPIDLRAIVFAGIIIGAVGAVMDVAVSISASLSELKNQAPDLTFKEIYKSGINIGRDIMGSMTNTLVLAYIGSSLSIMLLLIVFAGSLTELLNRELILVEILQALVGGMGILLTIPLTALVCAFLYSKKTSIRRD